MSKSRKKALPLSVVLIACLLIGFNLLFNQDTVAQNDSANTYALTTKAMAEFSLPVAEQFSSSDSANVEVHFIDVGQGDATLVESAGHYLLIDAGETDQGDKLVTYLKEQGISNLDYVIGTHPHSDHIGGLPAIINSFPIQTILLPKVQTNTLAFEDLLLAIKNKDHKIEQPIIGQSYPLGQAEFTVFSPLKDYGTDYNNWSIGIRLVCGQTSFIFYGDTEKAGEKDILASDTTLKSDVLRVAHHGSNTSTSQAFLNAVSPTYAVISVGLNNNYGHPSQVILDRLKKKNVQLFRTDQTGTIIAYSDGQRITWNDTQS